MKNKIWNWTAYLWDCLQVMDLLIQEWVKVDAIITDPPYNIDIVWKWWWDTIENYQDYMLNFYNKCRLLTNNIIIFFDYSYTLLFEQLDTPFERFIWHREWGFRWVKIKKWYEPFYWYWDWSKYNRITELNHNAKTDKRLKEYRTVSNVWNIPNLVWRKKESVWHPTQKPLKLINRIVEMVSDEWDVILDPFAWSFTTAVACENLNRQWIWIEKDETYFNIWLERINKLWIENATIVKQNNQ